MVAIQELLYDGEYVFCCNPDITFLHISLFFMIVRIKFFPVLTQKKCQIRLYLTFCLYAEILSEFR
ncbi:hypothetical protein BACPLE_00755 [Phocaeicola plebeius DSM 17135]|uniref:Uncharacterized protein n=1 Tax=Phocaeicola plebeius (strain DSM 17135 / JCM 12973 / CCUG 54634 / M2) TaxID=484018 RepID=B5CVM3_PHOPM|nr:hypothetical protein BACPLE_00755 [Phocaeicola plebeius DSM 17135]